MTNFDFKDPDTIRFLDKLKSKFERQNETTSAEANETERSLSGQLILLTTVLITVNILVLSDESVIKHITSVQKSYVLAALVLESLATIAGIVNYLMIEKSYNSWAKTYYRCAEIINKRQYKDETELTKLLDAEQSKVKPRTIRATLRIQIVAILLSLSIYLLLLFNLFFLS